MTGSSLVRWTAPGRRGEGRRVKVQSEENQTVASITFQNYFRLYKKLCWNDRHSGHRGVRVPADLRARDVVVIPTHRPMVRQDQARSGLPHAEATSSRPIIEDIKRLPEARASLSWWARRRSRTSELTSGPPPEGPSVTHQVLNAKQHERWKRARRGRGRQAGHVMTIATNMAGPRYRHRTWRQSSRSQVKIIDADESVAAGDHGSPSARKHRRRVGKDRHEAVVIAAGGLRIIGTERHESRRIDNQLRGRSGRQGDPGSSRASTCLSKTTLMRIFAGDRVNAPRACCAASKHAGGGSHREPASAHALRSSVRTAQGGRARNFDVTQVSCWNTTMWPMTSASVIYQQRNQTDAG